MTGTLHALGIVFTVVVALGTSIRWPARPTWRRGLASAIVAVLGVMVGLVALHACDAGVPLTQWLVPTLGAMATVLFCGAPLPRLAATGVALGIAIALSLHFTQAVHEPGWTGNPESRSLEGQPASAEWHTPLTGLFRR